jgi:hypothetical protein
MGEAAAERLTGLFAGAGLDLGPPDPALPRPPRLGFWATWRAARIRGTMLPCHAGSST